ncbi:MAG TPA: HPr-rel-A system PqqD family peptide chaperone [Burkholderiaceae bacterium]|nr:HPr-rel-A system PqqD family peptide chaperone [Burkholderiaceae bacterium]
MEPPDVRFAAVDNLRVRAFDDEAVVFEPLSWDAHLLNPAALAVLELILEAPRSMDDVAAFLADALQPVEQSEAPAHAARLIGELQSLGLVLPVEGSSRADR